VHSASDTRAGVLVALTPLVATLLAPVGGAVADRVGTRTPLIAGGGLLCVAGALLAGSVVSGGAVLVAGLVIAGAGISMIQSPAAAEVTRAAGGEAGSAIGVFNAGRLVSGALGTALFTLVFQLAGSIDAGTSLDTVADGSLVTGFRGVFVAMALAGGLALTLAVVFRRRFWHPSWATAGNQDLRDTKGRT
jgi:MFS family permease